MKREKEKAKREITASERSYESGKTEDEDSDERIANGPTGKTEAEHRSERKANGASGNTEVEFIHADCNLGREDEKGISEEYKEKASPSADG